MNQNLYRIGDWVYCEISPHLPYSIRKIEELTKNQNGNIEARVTCAFRRRDISTSLLMTLDKNPFYMITQLNSNSDIEDDFFNQINTNTSNLNKFSSNDEVNASSSTTTTTTSLQQNQQQCDDISDLQKYQLKHRELFYSKYSEQIQVSIIRGKCNVYLYSSDLDNFSYYLNNEDTFYYQLTYDPNQKKLLSDEGKIRVGSKYQAEIPLLIKTEFSVVDSDVEREDSLWNYNQCVLNDDDFKKFLIISQSIGTYARALDYSNTRQNYQPNLLLSAANASRDITLFNAYKFMHESSYDLKKALLNFIPSNGNCPVLCKDEIENWSVYEMNLFEEGLDKLGKNFNEIKRDYLPWKTINSIVEYYYLWKTTDRYVTRKQLKESQSRKLNHFYMPNHQKQHQAQIVFKNEATRASLTCDSCNGVESINWFLANISQEQKPIQYQSSTQYLQSYSQVSVAAHVQNQDQQHTSTAIQQTQQTPKQFQQAKLCSSCWSYWKKYGSFKYMGSKGGHERPGPDRRSERINSNRGHKCSIEECGKEFKLRSQLAKHLMITHCMTMRSGSPKPMCKSLKSFYLHSTPLTKAARLVCLKTRHHALHPFKSVDFVKFKNDWSQEPRNIRDILEEHKRNVQKKFSCGKKKSITELFDLNNPKKENIDMNTNSLLKYQSVNIDTYQPQRFAFPKPSDEFLVKFFQNLSSNKKRSYDSVQIDTASDDSCTSYGKRTLFSNNNISTSQQKAPVNSNETNVNFNNIKNSSYQQSTEIWLKNKAQTSTNSPQSTSTSLLHLRNKTMKNSPSIKSKSFVNDYSIQNEFYLHFNDTNKEKRKQFIETSKYNLKKYSRVLCRNEKLLKSLLKQLSLKLFTMNDINNESNSCSSTSTIGINNYNQLQSSLDHHQLKQNDNNNNTIIVDKLEKPKKNEFFNY